MAKGVCCDCGKRRNIARMIVRLVGGALLGTCAECWERYEYAEFMYRKAAL